jgi:hydroxylaminobenzene mutase
MMIDRNTEQPLGRRLLQLGMVLFLLGLVTGFLVPVAANPRMALSSHLEGVLNGVFLLVLGAIWERLHLAPGARRLVFGLAIYGTFVNWGTTLLAAVWGAGESMMPLAGAGHAGTSGQEMLIAVGLLSLSVSMLVVGGMVLWGLRRLEVAGESTSS